MSHVWIWIPILSLRKLLAYYFFNFQKLYFFVMKMKTGMMTQPVVPRFQIYVFYMNSGWKSCVQDIIRVQWTSMIDSSLISWLTESYQLPLVDEE